VKPSPGPAIQNGARPGRRGWPGWIAPLAAAALVVAVIAASVAVAGSLRHQPSTSAPAGPGGLPPYYVALTTQKPDSGIYLWRGAIITPDGRTVLGVEQIILPGPVRYTTSERLVRFSTATGRQTAVINNLDPLKLNGYEQALYTNADGGVLVVTYLRPGLNATILHGGRSTPLPWSPYIGAAAW